MLNRSFIMSILGLLFCVSLHAESKQQLTINGETVSKEVAKMTFDGNQVVLHFADQSSQTTAMSTVVLSFEWDTDTGVYTLKHDAGEVLNIEGLAPGTVITLYDAAGHQVLSATAAEASTVLSTQALRSGVYLLKADKQVVKFIKK